MKIEKLINGFEILQRDDLLKLGADAMLLADFARVSDGERVCDLGAGVGAVTLLLAAKHASLHLTAVEFYPPAFELLERNVAHNRLEQRVTPLCCDLRELPTTLYGRFDVVVCNPPYHRWSIGQQSPPTPERSDRTATPDDVSVAASKLLKNGGRLSLVVRPDRLCDYFVALRAAGVEPKVLRMCAHKPDAPPSVALVEAVKGAGCGVTVAAELIVNNS